MPFLLENTTKYGRGGYIFVSGIWHLSASLLFIRTSGCSLSLRKNKANKKKQLINGLYILAVILLLTNIFLRSKDGEINILFWEGVLIVAIAMLIQGPDKKGEKRKKRNK
ncbi:MAG: hypothetical protein ACI8P3_001277 [Saprospiraceae bacterium]